MNRNQRPQRKRVVSRPKAAAKPKTPARPRTVVPAKRIVKRKARQVPMTNRPQGAAKTMLGQFAFDKKIQCLSPTTITPVTASVYQVVMDVIDEVLFAIAKFKPGQFMFSPTFQVAVPFAIARGYYIAAFQYYMFKHGLLNGTYSGGTDYENLKIPFAIAKVFQQFAPYHDPLTGSTCRSVVSPQVFTINNTYFSVDSNTASAIGNLNGPHYRHLIHPSKYNGATELSDFATLGNKSFQPFSTPSSPWNTFVATIPTKYRSALESLLPGIRLCEIPGTAPDASAYVELGVTCVASGFPVFRADMGVILGGIASGTTADREFNLPYDKPFPVCRALVNGFVQQAGTAAYGQTITAVYASLTCKAQAWDAGPAINLLKSTPEFTTVKDFSYRASQIDYSALARRFFAVYRTVTLVDSPSNVSYALSTMFWSEIYARLAKFGTCDSTGDPATNMCFFAENSATAASRLPVNLVRMISGIGPVVIQGRVYFPGFPNINQTVPDAKFNSTSPWLPGWASTLSPAGTWTVDADSYGIMTGVTSVGVVNVYRPGSLLQLTRTDPANVVYTGNSVWNFKLFAEYYQNKLPIEFAPDLLPTQSNNYLGCIFSSQIGVSSSFATTTTAVWTNSLVSSSRADSVLSVFSNVCITRKEAILAALFSPIRVSGSPANTSPQVRPMVYLFDTAVTDIGVGLQTTCNASTNSQMRQLNQMKNIEFVSKKMKGRKGGDINYAAAVRGNQIAIEDSLDTLAAPGNADRTDVSDNMLMWMRNGWDFALESVATVSQGEWGDTAYAAKNTINLINGKAKQLRADNSQAGRQETVRRLALGVE